MNPELVFTVCSNIALVSWLVLFVFYHKGWVYPLLFSVVLIILSLFYLYYIIPGMTGDAEGGFSSLAEVALLFGKKEALLAGWIHYLAFDLFVGMWMASDSLKLKLSRWILLPCLIFTFMLGPVGFLLYFIIRSIKQKQVWQPPYTH
ncbi:ABA4-like family protein [Pararhodonellum marinum]|uniref:ABA4-like family protein n=1 Tax=Pararhodonellum marinum TaxID=2755358 RepID=UPI00188DF806|nr:ABA4-like family protein [Pararhodonellum marinum]